MLTSRQFVVGSWLILAITVVGTVFVAAEASSGKLDVSDLKIATSGAIIAVLFIPPLMWKFKHTFSKQGRTHHGH